MHLYCSLCGQSFKNSDKLNNHKNIHNICPTTFKCTYCDKILSNKGYLKTHEMIHTEEKPFGCAHCPKHFTDKSTLQTHEKIHTGDQKFVGVLCSKLFTQEGNLKTHQKTYNGENHIACNQCGRVFRSSEKHMKHQMFHKVLFNNPELHLKQMSSNQSAVNFTDDLGSRAFELLEKTNDGKFQCRKCNRKVKNIRKAVFHAENHLNLTFQCPLCSSTFANRGTLKEHMRMKHNTFRAVCL